VIEIVISSITGLCVVGAALGGLARWMGRLDGLKDAVDRLTSAMDKSGNTLLDHEIRITKLEEHEHR